MNFKLHYDADANLTQLHDKKIAIFGYGSQGHAHALNLKDSGLHVAVALRAGSASTAKALAEGLQVFSLQEAAQWADIMMLLLPEENHKEVYERYMQPELKPGKALAVAHGFSVHFKQITPPEDVDVFMVAPKGPGHTVRREYENGSGVPCLFAVHQNASGHAKELALAYAKGIGGTRAGVVETTFREETETDLFGEQAVLCGGLTSLIQAGFETLVEAGYSPAMAYFECLHEMKLIVDLVWEGGIANMRYSISNTAEYGDYASGPKVIDSTVKQRMKKILRDIQTGAFADQWIHEYENGCPNLSDFRKKSRRHLIEEVGAELRSKIQFPDTQKKMLETTTD